jgi:predicted RecA/RadA family phage recombinase
MKNYVQRGENVTLAAPYAVASGAGALVGSLFGVASTTLGNGESGEFVTTGVFDLAKVGSQAWTVGAKIYWDDTNKYCTTTASGNTLIGVALAAVGSGAGETIGRVRLGIVA